MADAIEHVEGVPRWFTRLFHVWSVRRCHRIGHVVPGAAFPLYVVCSWCGQLFKPGEPRTYSAGAWEKP